ncbi:MAG TPA: AFG1/ZapE family ATPase, partial [Sphingomicrobium sp.]|nr:AFG1/ZapE family ATPase [Sphingomicrobium sp.]
MTGPVGRTYSRLLHDHELKPDAAQQRAVAALDGLAHALGDGSRGILGLFGKKKSGPAGVYLWGGVGRGKSMLMDLAFMH